MCFSKFFVQLCYYIPRSIYFKLRKQHSYHHLTHYLLLLFLVYFPLLECKLHEAGILVFCPHPSLILLPHFSPWPMDVVFSFFFKNQISEGGASPPYALGAQHPWHTLAHSGGQALGLPGSQRTRVLVCDSTCGANPGASACKADVLIITLWNHVYIYFLKLSFLQREYTEGNKLTLSKDVYSRVVGIIHVFSKPFFQQFKEAQFPLNSMGMHPCGRGDVCRVALQKTKQAEEGRKGEL